MRIVLFAPLPPEAITGRFPDVDVVTVDPSTPDPAATCEGADVVISDWSSRVRVAGDIVDALAPTCRLVQVPAAGLDSVDVEACRSAGVPVASCGGLNTVAVAEWCVYAAIGALRHFAPSDRALHRGEWEQLGHARYELARKTVGIVGLGAIGTAVAERLACFDVDLVYWTRRRRDRDEEERLSVRWSELDDLVAEADVLILAVALTDDTRGLLDADRIERMKNTSVVVNAARGEVTDEAALATALREQRLHGAAIDAFSTEPVPSDHPLLDAPSTLLTPHVGGVSVESSLRIIERVYGNIERLLEGEEPEGLL